MTFSMLESVDRAERTILGTILIRPAAIKLKETESLTADDFSGTGHRAIYRAMLTASESDAPLEIAVPDILRARGELTMVGGYEYISSLVDNAMDHPSLESYIKILKEHWLRRKIITISELAAADAENFCESASVIAKAISDLEALRDAGSPCESILVPWSVFSQLGLEEVDWLVEGIIEIGTNGFILGPPKSSKSWAAEALAVSLVTGEPWFGQKVKRRRVALVSREDHAGMTARRVRQLMRGKDVDPSASWVNDCFWINSRAQARLLLLTESSALRNLIATLKSRGIEFLILDVLGVMHEGDENEVKEMRAVLRSVEQIASEVGCQICIVHHARKGCDWNDSLSNWARGSSVIAGFAEWMMGCMVADETEGIIHSKFDTKADLPIRPFYWQIQSFPERKALELNRVDYEPSKNGPKEKPF